MNVITVRRMAKRTTNQTWSTRRSFRELTRSYFASEKGWEFVMELLLFAIIVAISAWPIVAAAGALSETKEACRLRQKCYQAFDLPMSVNAVPAPASANAVPMIMTTLKPETKDSSTARRISRRVAGS